MKEQKQKKWRKFRHRVVRNIAAAILLPYAYFRYGFRRTKYKNKEKRQFLIITNHQTAFDQFFVGLTFPGPIYYIASEDLFSKGFVSSLIRYLVAPIPFKKSTNDIGAVRTCMRVAKEGGTISLCPEGNRTYSGHTGYIKPSILKLCKVLKLPVAVLRIEGGYGVQPRWADNVRRGKIYSYVKTIIEPEELQAMSNDELMQRLSTELYVDDRNLKEEYHHKNLAEYLERAVYYCPNCGLSTWESKGSQIHCKKCETTLRYQPDKSLQLVKGSFPYHNATEWWDAQCDFVNGLDLTPYNDTPMYEDNVRLMEVVLCKKKNELFASTPFRLYGNRYYLGERELSFEDISAVSVLGRNKLNIYFGDTLWQVKGDKHFNAIKYMNIFYHYHNLKENHHEFLGL